MKTTFQIPILICFLAFTTPSVHSQAQNLFPEAVSEAYFNELYRNAAVLAFQDLHSVEDESAARFIRIAYFMSWDNKQDETSISQRNTFIDLWKGKYPDPIPLDSIGPGEQADYYAIEAIMAFNKNNSDEADSLIRQSIRIRQLNTRLDSCIQADNIQFLGTLAKNRMDFVTSMEFYTEALRINNHLNRKKAIAGIYIEQAPVFLKTDPENPEILKNLNAAASFFKQHQDLKRLSWTYNELGNYYSIHRETEQAIQWFKAVVELDVNESTATIHSAYNNISAMYALLAKNDSTIYYMRKALNAVEADDFESQAFYLSNLGAIFGSLNQPDSALSCFKQALRLLDPGAPVESLSYNPNPEQFAPILPTVISYKGNALFELYKNTGDLQELDLAMKSLATAISQFNTIRAYSNTDNRLIFGTDSREFYFLALKIAAERFRLNPDKNHADEVIQYSQQSKAAVFNDFQRILKARNNLRLDPELIHKDDSIKQVINRLNQQYLDVQRNQTTSIDAASAINLKIIQAKEELRGLNNQISQLYPGYAKYIENPDLANLSLIRKKLGQNEYLIDYTYSGNMLLMLGIDQDSIKIIQRPLNQSFSDEVGEYLMLLNEKTGSHFKRLQMLAFYFWEQFLQPFEQNIKGKDLIIIPDGIIGYLPFDTFVKDSTPPDRKHYFELDLVLKHHATRYLSSFNQLISDEPLDKQSVMVYAFAPFTNEPYVDNHMTLARLKGSKQEVEAISKHARVKAFYNHKATKEAFLMETGESNVVHLATHGLLSSGNPMNNRILFTQNSDDSNLALYEVINQPIHADLVVLSACETGTGDLTIGEGIMSLTRGFHNAGTPSLIMSLWPAYDRPSVKIMDVFYRELNKRQKMSHALQQAKLEFLKKSKANTSHPSFWANYQLSGQDAALNLKPTRLHQLLVLIPLLLLIVSLVWLIKRKAS